MHKIFTLSVALLSFYTARTQDWQWKNPLPTGNLLNCVEFTDSSTAYAIGNYGTILKTKNGGIVWEIQESGTNIDLYTMSVIDKDTIYVCGQQLNVFKTTNGGITWKHIFNKSWSSNTNFIFFVTPAVGYIAGDGTTLFKTTDYGKSWTDLNVGLEFQQITSIYFTSVDTGYASVGYGMGGKILKTTDGGFHWSAIDLPLSESLKLIRFLNDSTGYLIGQLGAILKTTDSGNSWDIQNEFPNGVTSSELLAMDFIDENLGYIVGARDILKTVDGGNTWELVAQSDFDLLSVSFVDSIHGIAVGGDWIYEASGIRITSDGGLNWNMISSNITTNYIDEIKFVNSDTGYAVGGYVSATYCGYIIKTTNAGDTWSALNTGVNTYWLTDIAILGEDTIIVVAWEGQILKSTNGGITWTEQNSNTSASLYALHFVNSNTGYAVGEDGTIVKTTDGGMTWIQQQSPTDKHLHSVFFKDANTGYIPAYDWGIDSTILITTIDGGENWTKKSIGTLQQPWKICFVNNDTAFIVGDFGGIMRTFDGGYSWDLTYHHGNTYYDIDFTNTCTGYVVGEDGEISLTENCGNNWTVINSGTEKQLRSVFFTNVNTGYVVGSNGVILKTTNSGSPLKSINQPYQWICLGDTVLLKPNFIGGTKPLSYQWQNSETSSAIPAAPKDDTVFTVTIIDNESDSITIEIPVYVIVKPAPVITQNGDTLISDILHGNQWYRNDTLLEGATSANLVVESIGSYYSIASDYYCTSDKSNIIQIDFNSVSYEYANEFRIYPNPVTDYLTIELPNNNSKSILKIMSCNGQEYINYETTKNFVQLYLVDLPYGYYIIQLIQDNEILTEKIIKK